VYFHGNGGNLAMWSGILVALAREGFDVTAVDYRGYGMSTGSPSEQGLYRDAEATVDYLHDRLRRAELPVVYWGRSIGAAVAARAAAHRAPNGVVLEAGFPTARAILVSNPVMLLLSFFATYRFATAEWMSAVTAPALVIHGDRDSIIPYRLGQQLYAALPGPKRFVTIAGGDHNDAAPADAAVYWTAVHDFISSLRVSQP
jgi:pimeloyl-ACP methyl ester carboxylesterase